MKNIAKNEELTIDYSITEGNHYWKMNCNCQQKNCRKVIKSVRYLSKELFLKYESYLLPFLKEEWKKCN